VHQQLALGPGQGLGEGVDRRGAERVRLAVNRMGALVEPQFGGERGPSKGTRLRSAISSGVRRFSTVLTPRSLHCRRSSAVGWALTTMRSKLSAPGWAEGIGFGVGADAVLGVLAQAASSAHRSRSSSDGAWRMAVISVAAKGVG